MINYFKKIRHGLITENRIKKYLLYAIGEIILVVIGIIIALMLNDWHTKSLLEKEKAQFTQALINDYTLDTLALNSFISKTSQIEQQLQKLNDRAYQVNANLDTIISIAQNDYTPDYYYLSNLNTSAFRSLEASGKIELFDVNLRTKIIQHNQKQNLLIDKLKLDAQAIISKTDDYTSKYKIGSVGNSDTYLTKLSWKIENEREFVVLFTEMIGINRLFLGLWTDEYQLMLQDTRQMIALLKEMQ